jgi:hypothetical protein
MTYNRPEPEWVPKFLEELTTTRKAKRSARAAGIASSTAYYRRNTNRQFAAAWQAALASEKPAAAAADSPEPAFGQTTGWRVRFLEALAETSNVTASAIRANVPIRTIYKARREDRSFAAKWRAALFEGYDNLEMEVLGHLRDANPARKMDVASALRLLAAHRETVERERALREEDDDDAVKASIVTFLERMRQRRLANEKILLEGKATDVAE